MNCEERELNPCEDSCGMPVSTIAMTAYNWVASQGGPRTPDEILVGVRTWNKRTTENDIKRALVALVSRQLMVQTGPLHDVRDKQRRVVFSRDRNDPLGWAGWRVKKLEPRRGVSLDEALENQ